MSKLRFAVTKIVSKLEEDLANYDIVGVTFAEAYAELRKACPGGDLYIHLYVEADSAEQVGVKYDDGQ